jgi:ATP-binding cassette subfamily B (MDR/TAP) protein 1
MAETEPDQKQPVRTPSFSDYLRVFGYATRWDLFICIIASLASIGAGITLPLMNVIFGQLTGQFTQYSTMTRHDFQQLLDRQALYIMALFLGRWALNTINKFCFRVIAIHLSSAIRLDYLQSLLAQPVHVIDSMPPGAPAISITATTNTLQLGISERLGTLLESITTIISAIIIAFIWSWSLALVTSSLMLYIMFVLAALLPLILKSQTATTKADAEGTAVASEALGGVRLVMACGAQDYILSRYQVCVTEALKRAQKMSPLVGSQVGLLVCSGIYVLDALM